MGRITETVKVLIICNVLFFAGTLLSGEIVYRLFSLYYFENPNFQVWQPVTHMFMHGGFMHILFNMYALWAFGSPLEERWGRNKFLFFYFSAGLGAALIHSLVSYYEVHSVMAELLNGGWSQAEIQNFLINGKGGSESILATVSRESIDSLYAAFNTPAVGASGAIYGVLVAFGMMYPNVGLMLIFFPVPVKAKYFIPGLILLDLFSGLTGFSLFGQNIANWAHLGGALFGFLMAYYWKKNSFNDHRWN
ncbi:rhomboid family intramembrane serine protease [Aureisphaera sp. CAU 1614]|uniref:Rhomboid family intramembrane serine protease n=1 Tax=Halomarinibacterium sedimenti TaxID=2857106 RepID=A0A9X1FQ06_9FLAO|nr:rhomboid family intramembrane serine protease [Halomarinibacterium sedimenti]MAL60293.1 rhomboid family intramembrane serine protease [Flavobacteriaceae bacterium]MBW2938318.1 rhomboid family intramembrane serine protease [Halomarinibacterium sedimenti]HAT65111.1 rhomboid family intramembrane serine protease [Flavobacteriaceae bacterium]|tara:strand:+ start:29 stop:775 length:747 start_codon:yes stop_codon:yes gene_type:complete